MNGTHLNGKKVGGREKGETPEQGAKRSYPSTDLKHGDQIHVGLTRIEVRIQADHADRHHQSLVRNPKDRFPDAGKLPAALSKAKP